MKRGLVGVGATLLTMGTPAFGHRLDEYLQATTITVAKDRFHAEVRLTPGVAVFPFVLASIDSNADGLISESERQAYAARVLSDLSLTIDGRPTQLRLASTKFAKTEDMKQGLGEIEFDFEADVPRGRSQRRVVFQNHHQSRIAAYLVNCLVPRDPDVRITGQNRNYEQSWYQLDYSQTGADSGPLTASWWLGGAGWILAVAIFLIARLAWLLPAPRPGTQSFSRRPSVTEW